MISRILLRMDNRYLTAKERSDLSGYLSTARARRSALEEVRRTAVRVADDVITAMRRAYPQFTKHRPQGFDKGHRDMVLLTQMAANAMFLGETATIDDQFTHWYRTMLKGVHLTPQFLADTFAEWLRGLERNLSADAFALLKPYAEHLAAALADVLDPAKDEVGERCAMA